MKIGKLWKTYKAGFSDPTIRLGYGISAVGALAIGALSVVTKKHFSPEYLMLGPAPLFGFMLVDNYIVGKRKLIEKEED